MKRRTFIRTAAGTALAAVARPVALADVRRKTGPSYFPDEEVNPYFFDSPDYSPEEKSEIEEYLARQTSAFPTSERQRGRPRRAPTYRFVHWATDTSTVSSRKSMPDEDSPRFKSPVALQPIVSLGAKCEFNAQIMNFRLRRDDWKGKRRRGVLMVEFRGRRAGEPLTWSYLQQFDVYRGEPTINREFVCERDGHSEPMRTDGSNVDVRFQLFRNRKKVRVLNKLLGVAASLMGVDGSSESRSRIPRLPSSIHLPESSKEIVHFTQGLMASVSDGAPIWRSGFNSYSLAAGASRMAIIPGLWVVMDESEDLTELSLDDHGGAFSLTRRGREVDTNYLVLDVFVREV